MTHAAIAEAPPPQAKGSELPVWNLGDLYAGPDDPKLAADFDWAQEAAEGLQRACMGKLAQLSGEALGDAIRRYESTLQRLHGIMSYAQLRFAADMSDPERGRFLQNCQERYNDISAKTLFFALELNRIDDATMQAQLAAAPTGHYASWIRDSRMFRPHQLSDELEQMLHDRSVAGASAWTRLFDQTLSEMRASIDGEALTLADALNRFDNADPAVRKSAAQGLGGALGERVRLFSLVINTLIKDKEVDDRWRKYPQPVSFRNLANCVEDEVVAALVATVRESYADLAHRYYAMKARWLGRDVLDYWDRNAPLPGDDGRIYTWDEARGIVLDAFGGFDPRMAEIAGRFFDGGWLDAGPRPGKDSGAFCHPVVPSVHPYILMNFYGRPRDITTLAHELGHGVHQVLAAQQGLLMSDTPLTLAESASVFGEMLVFRSILDRETDPAVKRRLLAGKVENMLNTVVRQVAFHVFEERLHGERRQGELSAERICEIWLDIQRESLGPVFRFEDEYRYYWSYISHFVHAPFYVYAYAFGDCLVNTLYQLYREGHAGFADKYIAMLGAGGTLRHKELLAPFGLDASQPDFWRRGIGVISGFIDELEAMG